MWSHMNKKIPTVPIGKGVRPIVSDGRAFEVEDVNASAKYNIIKIGKNNGSPN